MKPRDMMTMKLVKAQAGLLNNMISGLRKEPDLTESASNTLDMVEGIKGVLATKILQQISQQLEKSDNKIEMQRLQDLSKALE